MSESPIHTPQQDMYHPKWAKVKCGHWMASMVLQSKGGPIWLCRQCYYQERKRHELIAQAEGVTE